MWTDTPRPVDFFGGEVGTTERVERLQTVPDGGVVGVGPVEKMKTQKTFEVGGAGETRNKVNDSDGA